MALPTTDPITLSSGTVLTFRREPNGSQSIHTDRAGGMLTESEWQEYCALAKASNSALTHRMLDSTREKFWLAMDITDGDVDGALRIARAQSVAGALVWSMLSAEIASDDGASAIRTIRERAAQQRRLDRIVRDAIERGVTPAGRQAAEDAADDYRAETQALSLPNRIIRASAPEASR